LHAKKNFDDLPVLKARYIVLGYRTLMIMSLASLWMSLAIPSKRGRLDHVMEGFRTSAMYSSKSTGDMPLLAL